MTDRHIESGIPTKWATVCVEYGDYNGNEKGRLECCDSASFTLHRTEAAAMDWVHSNISAGQMVAVMKVERLFGAKAIEITYHICAGGVDPGFGECPKCGATMDDECAGLGERGGDSNV